MRPLQVDEARAEENGDVIESEDEEIGDIESEEEEDEKFARDSDSDVDPDEELPPELAKILGVEQKGAKGSRNEKNAKTATTTAKPAKPAKLPNQPKEKKPKARMGQRARRAMAFTTHGDNANHVKAVREERDRTKRQAAEQEANMHPAWAAKRAAAAALDVLVGTKVAFGEDGAAAGNVGHAGPRRSVPAPPAPGGGRGGGGRGSGANDFGGRGAGRGGGRDGGGGRGGAGGGYDRGHKTQGANLKAIKKAEERESHPGEEALRGRDQRHGRGCWEGHATHGSFGGPGEGLERERR